MEGGDPGSLGVVLEKAVQRLAGAGLREARLHGEYLMAHVLQCDRGGLFVQRNEVLPATRCEQFESMVQRRLQREPLQHILGEQPFHDVLIEVSRDVLIPRPETEALVEHALRQLPRDDLQVADLGTGSGCIAIALAHARPEWRFDAVDRSDAALTVARQNADRAGVSERICWHQRDFAHLPRDWMGRFGLVVSNPPYVRAADHPGLEPEVRDHDPYDALVSGPTGLEAFEVLAPVVHRLLLPGGRVLLEFGFGQEGAVAHYFDGAGFNEIRIRPDLSGIPRILDARRNGHGR